MVLFFGIETVANFFQAFLGPRSVMGVEHRSGICENVAGLHRDWRNGAADPQTVTVKLSRFN